MGMTVDSDGKVTDGPTQNSYNINYWDKINTGYFNHGSYTFEYKYNDTPSTETTTNATVYLYCVL